VIDRRRRDAATRLDHALVEGDRCTYCGDPVAPRLSRTGATRHLDHFIPLDIIARAREAWPNERFDNWLVPCCIRCNTLAGVCYFSTLADKASYVRWRRGELASAPVPVLRVPDALQALIRPMTEYRIGDYLILAPAQLPNGAFTRSQDIAEKALRCSFMTTLSAASKTGVSFSAAM
jgi:hypothetical protein